MNIGYKIKFMKILHQRSANKSLLAFRVGSHLMDDVVKLLDENNISYIKKTGEKSTITIT